MEPVYEIELRYDKETRLTLLSTDDPTHLAVTLITPGRVLEEYQKHIMRHAREHDISEFPFFESYELYSMLTLELSKPSLSEQMKSAVRNSFRFMQAYPAWSEVTDARKGYLKGAEIYFCTPSLVNRWFFKDKVEDVEVKFLR